MTISELKAIREDHPTGWRGIFDSYPIKTMVSDLPFLFSLLITILGVIAFIVTEKSSYVLLIWFIDMVKSLFPNLLGFCLGGYAILIGFGNTDLLKSLTRKLRSINKSVFQLLSAVFAFSLILQSVSLIISYVFSFFVQFNLFHAPEPICKYLNIFFFCVVSLPTFWAIFLLPVIALNVFTFGQLHHFKLTIEQKREDEEFYN